MGFFREIGTDGYDSDAVDNKKERKIMAKKMDATFANILNTIDNAKDNATEALRRAKETIEAAEDAVYLLNETVKLIKIRREEE